MKGNHMKISGNTIINCGGGIKVSGNGNADIYNNRIDKTKVAIEVDETLNGTIANNEISEASQHAILVNKVDPYIAFNIPSEINKDILYELFKKLDEANTSQYEDILKESTLSKVDQFTSIAERIINFTKDYGPMLIAYYAPFLLQ